MRAKQTIKRRRPPQQRTIGKHKRLRAQGLRLVQHWVPDLRDPRVRADIRREAKLLARHPETAAIDDWIDASYDWRELR